MEHREVWGRVVKGIRSAKDAGKLVKVLGVLGKCLRDAGFVGSREVDSEEKWRELLKAVVDIDDRAIGSFSELCQMFGSINEVLSVLKAVLEGKRP